MTLIRVCFSASFVFGRVFVHAVVCVCIRGCTSACFVVCGSISRTVAVARVRECMKISCHVITILEINIRTLDEKVHLLTRKVHEHVDKRLILCMSALGIDHCLHSAWH